MDLLRRIAGYTLFASLLLPAQSGAQSIVGLGAPPGYQESAAAGVSHDGSVVAVNGMLPGNGLFRWTAATGHQSLGALPGGSGGWVSGMTPDGAMLVGRSSARAFVWTESAGMQPLALLPGTGGNDALSVARDGSAIVGWNSVANGMRAVRWREAAAPAEDLGTLPGHTRSAAHGVSSGGTVVVGYSEISPGVGLRPFRWQEGAGMTDLGVSPGTSAGYASGVSDDGAVVIGTCTNPFGSFPFRWTAAGGLEDLGTLPGWSSGGDADAVSADGSVIVGAAGWSPGLGEAWIWTEAEGMRSIESVLSATGVNLGGWQLNRALAVSPDGRVIAGVGTRNGVQEAWVAVIPAPGGALVLSCGLALTRRRTRARLPALR